MSFLDRFKRKASDDKTPDGAPEVAPEVKLPPPAMDPAPPRKTDPANAAAAAGYNPDFKLPPLKKEPAPAAAPAPTGPQHEITLELGDFIGRIPSQLLADEKPDLKTPVSFDISELADRIARGQTTVSAYEIYRRVPAAFRGEVLSSDNTEIRFPWQKVMKMLVAYRSSKAGPAPAGLSMAAADSLAEKLRSRRAVRNIIPGSPADPQPAVAGPSPAAASASAPAAAPIPKPEFSLPPVNPEDDEKLTREEALRARDSLRTMLARIKGEYERHLAASEQQRKALSEEREKMVVELIKAKKDSEDKNEQVEFEKSVAAKSSENLSKVQQERDSLRLELSNTKAEANRSGQQIEQKIRDLTSERDALAQQQANLSKQITEFQKRGKIGGILGAAEAAAPALAAGAAGAGAALAAAERSQKEYQRQVEELHRRIGILESSQKEGAQELGREREAKIKVERQLTAANRLQEESAAKVQELQATLQREHEATLQKREAEAARALKEAQEQVATHAAANTKLSSDLEETRQKLASAQQAVTAAPSPEELEARISSQYEADIETYRNRIKALLQEKQAIGTDKEQLAAQLDSRTKELADIAAEKEALAKTSSEHLAKGDPVQLRVENEKLQAQLQGIQTQHGELEAKISDHAQVSAQLEARSKELNQLVADKEALAKSSAEQLEAQSRQLSQIAAEKEALAKASAEQLAKGDPLQFKADNEKLQAQIASLQAEHGNLSAKVSDRDQLSAQLEARAKELSQLAAEKEALAKASAEHLAKGDPIQLKADNEKLQAQIQSLQAERENLAAKISDRDQLSTQLEARAKELSQLAAEKEALAKASAEHLAKGDPIQLLAENEKLQAQIASLQAQQEALASKSVDHEQLATQLAARTEELNKLVAEKEALAKAAADRLAHGDPLELRSENEKLQGEIQGLQSKRDELTSKIKDLDGRVAGISSITARVQRLTAELESTDQELSDARNELAATTAKHQEELALAQQQHASQLGDKESLLQKLQTALPATEAELAQHRADKEKLVAELAAATAAAAGAALAAKAAQESKEKIAQLTRELEAARADGNSAVTTLQSENQKTLAERDALAQKHEALAGELTTLKSTHLKDREQLESELATVRQAREADAQALDELQAVTEKHATEKTHLEQELVNLHAAHANVSADSGALQAAHQKALGELQADRDSLQTKLETTGNELSVLRTQHDELRKGQYTLTTESAEARSVLEKSLTETTKHRDDLIARLEIMAGELAGAKQEHGLAFAALDRDRDALRASKESITAEFASTRAAHEKLIGELNNSYSTLQTAKEETDQRLAASLQLNEELKGRVQTLETTLAGLQTDLKAREKAMAKMSDDHSEAVSTLAGKHARALTAVHAERDAAVAKIVAEKAALATEVDEKLAAFKANHESVVQNLRDEKSDAIADLNDHMHATISALTDDRDKIRDALAEAERKYPAEIAALMIARDSAHSDSAAVAERLAAVSLDTEQKLQKITKELDTIRLEKVAVMAELEQAKETHKAQAGVFASEFKSVVKQRDDAIAHLESERASLAAKAAAFERDRVVLAAADAEAKSRAERDFARLRRERDSITQQRDALRTRIEKVVDEQRELLEDMTTQAAFTSMKHRAPVEKPPVAEDDTEAENESKSRESKKKESNVIDISEAEIVSPLQGGEGRLKMPRVRPVIIPPPQVRIL